MSWNINAAGLKEDVRAIVDTEPGHGDKTQLNAARVLILSEIDAWPTPGVHVKAWGHHDGHSRHLTIEINGVQVKPRAT